MKFANIEPNLFVGLSFSTIDFFHLD